MIKVPFTHFPNGDPGCEDYMIFENDGSMTSTMFGEISIKPSFKLYRTNLKRAVGSIRQNQYNELRYQLHQNKIEPYEWVVQITYGTSYSGSSNSVLVTDPTVAKELEAWFDTFSKGTANV